MLLKETIPPLRPARNTCSYCGLIYNGSGYSTGNEQQYCCYGCYLVEQIIGAQGDEGIASWILVRLGIGTFLAMNVMMISMVLYIEPPSALGASTIRIMHWALVILSTPALIILGSPFALGIIRNRFRQSISMDFFVLVTSLIAYGLSTVHVITGQGHIYFDTATMLLLIVTLGRLLEASAKSKASKTIKEMLDLSPQYARVIRNGVEQEIPLGELSQGELMLVKPGEKFPADGEIISGECLVDEAAFTGESRPRSCAPGDHVYGGSLNYDSLITVKATAVGRESLLSRIREIVEEAQCRKAPIERAAERAVALFVPAVWMFAVLAAIYWGVARDNPERAFLSSLSILVVACPCALGIATPIATSLAVGRAAGAGVLIRSGEVLERLQSVSRIFFDKTGTLTTNHLSLEKVVTSSEGLSEDEVLAWAASLEAGSEHSIGYTIVDYAKQKDINLGIASKVRTIPGRGIEGTVLLNGSERLVAVGSLKLLSERHSIPDDLMITDNRNGLTLAYAGWDGKVQAVFFLSDSLRDEAYQSLKALQSMEVNTSIISGDHEGAVARIACDLSIGEFYSGCTPVEKADVIRKACLSTKGGTAMVGDGINDAPALAEASVGISTGGGTDLAKHVSDVVLLGDDLSLLPRVLMLSRQTYRIIRQNLFWAFAYNGVAVVLAFFGYVHPLIAAVAMFISSTAVLSNSMRLVRESANLEETRLPAIDD